jgi:DNA-binding beta-propeller fold protein YncE
MIASVALASLALALPGTVAASGFGALSGPGGCLVGRGEGGSSSCTVGNGLVGANSVAVSPDGANVYVVGGRAGNNVSMSFGNLAILKRDQTRGAITLAGCLSSDGTDGREGATGACTPSPSLLGADGVAVSPDGLSVYVSSKSSASVVAFSRDPATGALTRLGCVQATPRPGAPCRAGNLFSGSRGVIVSADNTALYVAAPLEGAVSTLIGSTAPASGSGPNVQRLPVSSIFSTPPAPAFLANPCVAVNGMDGVCAVGPAMRGIATLALSPDGRQLYGASPGSSAVGVFAPNAEGALAETGCLKVEAPPGLCATSRLMHSPSNLAISPDGRNVYVGDSINGNGRINVLARDASSGQLADASCVDFLEKPRQEEASENPEESAEEKLERERERAKEREEREKEPPDVCERVPGLYSVGAIAVSGDGSSVYAFGQNSAVVFSRDPATGKLTESSCAAHEDDRCASLPSLAGVEALAVAPGGRQVYVVGSGEVAALGLGAAVTSARAAATRTGSAMVRVACPTGLRVFCRGHVELTRLLAHRSRRHSRHRAGVRRIALGASARFSIRPGAQTVVRVRLSGNALRLLRAHRHVRLAAVVRSDASGGGSGYGRHLILTLARS